jgi:hypothetical protein
MRLEVAQTITTTTFGRESLFDDYLQEIKD